MTRSLPTAPSDDLFDDADFRSPMDIARTEARRNNGRRLQIVATVVEAPAEVEPVKCARCGRSLHSAASRDRGVGPTCDRKLRAAMTRIGDVFSPRQIVAATELITDGGIVVDPHGICLAVSSRGDDTYVVNAAQLTCTCKAGQYGRPCFHLAAALAVTA